MANLAIRDGLLDRLQAVSGIQTDTAMAGAIGVSLDTYRRVRSGAQAPSAAFIAGVAIAFGLSVGEVATIAATEAA